MKIVIETSVLIGASVYWKCGGGVIKDKHFDKCNVLFDCLKPYPDLGIITKTVEYEAKGVLETCVLRTIRQTYFSDIKEKIKIMTLQHIISNDCLDRLEALVEETSTRPPINMNERNKVQSEIEPFLQEFVRHTVRYIQPHLPNFIKGQDAREEITES